MACCLPSDLAGLLVYGDERRPRGEGNSRWPSSTQFEVTMNIRSPWISGELVAGYAETRPAYRSCPGPTRCPHPPSSLSVSSWQGPSFSLSEKPSVSRQISSQRLVTSHRRSPSTQAVEQMPCSGQSLTRPEGVSRGSIARRICLSSRRSRSGSRGGPCVWDDSRRRCSCRRRPCRPPRPDCHSFACRAKRSRGVACPACGLSGGAKLIAPVVALTMWRCEGVPPHIGQSPVTARWPAATSATCSRGRRQPASPEPQGSVSQARSEGREAGSFDSGTGESNVRRRFHGFGRGGGSTGLAARLGPCRERGVNGWASGLSGFMPVGGLGFGRLRCRFRSRVPGFGRRCRLGGVGGCSAAAPAPRVRGRSCCDRTSPWVGGGAGGVQLPLRLPGRSTRPKNSTR